ncbi:ABC transporter ATP-binding protein [Vibrio nitrifigilis]|uniref:ABC transporter ATP-binding protein n=1 Tax=Vibrio nitrifigilis TaxID=2789781 RepID=A0ABS0GME7_9VIBR|nr:ABC transporter ATP-binding protein [Vibrio nitrifigilis]MBF9003409.1 ABC transporter ATP-binding protein [Vibrio nitrifigilis]
MRIDGEHLTISREGNTILHDVQFHLDSGRKLALIGPNGSGKSTLLRTLAGLEKEAVSHLVLGEERVCDLSKHQMATRVALVAQHSQLDMDLTVEALVRLGRTPYRGLFSSWSQKDTEAVEQALRQTQLTELRHHHWHQLSGGLQQRCQIARALAQQPDILLLDEPTNHLDIQYQLELMSLIESLPMTVVVSLHDLNLAVNYCTDVLLLNHGRVVACGHPLDVITEQRIAQVYGVKSSICHQSDGDVHIAFQRR